MLHLNQSDIQQNQFSQSQAQQWKMFQEQLKFQKDNQPSVWEEILGSLLGSGAKVATAYATRGA